MTKLRAFRRFAEDNRGSAVLTVVVTMLFVVALGTALLYTAYRGLQLSVLARNDKENFYDASAAMDEIKAGVQDEVSSALKTAYTNALVEYGKGTQTNTQVQAYLTNTFLTDLGALEIHQKDGSGEDKIVGGVFDAVSDNKEVSSVSLDIDLVESYYVSGTGTKVSSGSTQWDKEAGEVIVRGLTVRHTSEDGYLSEVATDLIIAIPDFFTGAAISANLGEYAIVAEGGLVGETQDAKIDGGVYAGSNGIKTSANDDKLEIFGGKIISTGAIEAVRESKLSVVPESYEIWAKEFIAGRLSTLSINGSTFVEDDLEINGGADVTIAGTYYGFGTQDASTGNSNLSSSIFINGNINGNSAKSIKQSDGSENTIKSSLDLKNLDQLVLGGVSFIQTKSAAYNVGDNANVFSNLATGQSVAAKTDQLAYLVPAEAVTNYNYKTNPAWIPSDEEIEAPVYNNKTYLWTTSDGHNRTLAYYLGITGDSTLSSGTYGDIVAYYTQKTDENDENGRVVYFFISFKDQNKANEYFRDYFTAKPDAISQYLDIYLALNSGPGMTAITKGSSYQYSNGNWSIVSGTVSNAQNNLACSYSDNYTRYAQSPFYLYVNQEKFDALDGTLRFEKNKKTVAIVTSGGCDDLSEEDYKNVRFIIARKNVKLSKAFQGVIIAKGKVSVSNNVTCVTDSVIGDATAELNGNIVTLADYLTVGLMGGSISTSDNEWSPDKLVYYRNWQKN